MTVYSLSYRPLVCGEQCDLERLSCDVRTYVYYTAATLMDRGKQPVPGISLSNPQTVFVLCSNV